MVFVLVVLMRLILDVRLFDWLLQGVLTVVFVLIFPVLAINLRFVMRILLSFGHIVIGQFVVQPHHLKMRHLPFR